MKFTFRRGNVVVPSKRVKKASDGVGGSAESGLGHVVTDTPYKLGKGFVAKFTARCRCSATTRWSTATARCLLLLLLLLEHGENLKK